ncbi:MAG: hypothetical protein R3271_14015 [Methylophaga sp.]|uniref:hypothetical protein n=1 Tax=Methylophaga sp. TaxID=2024840 RepID=UPI00299D37FC|nr:hypothetical protein [Methylophaga sp.]MDX1751421.1 hypothetical protein [Methylophaga sp.]
MANGKGKSVPPKATNRQQAKVVKTNQNQLIQKVGKPSWQFSTVDKAGPFAWPKGSPEESAIVEKLHSLDSMTWAEIQGKQHHSLSVSSLSTEAVKRLEEIKLDDEIDNLFSFHLQGKPRIICIRHNDLAYLLWHDPYHKVAPSKKKHT